MQRIVLTLTATLIAAAPLTAQDKKNPIVEIKTSMGTIKAELFASKAPITVKNFLKYTKAKHYDGTVFHRVIPDFMIQGGGLEANLKERPSGAGIKNESFNNLSNKIGTLAMARTPLPHSATSQFFINVNNNFFLDKAKARDGWGYCVFGRVIAGMDVVNRIKKVETQKVGPHGNVPVQPVTIKSVRVVAK